MPGPSALTGLHAVARLLDVVALVAIRGTRKGGK